MKKLLSICFLSILLGLLSFGVRAQSNNCSGFWIENLQPVTLTGVANSPSGDGTLVLNNVLNTAVVGNTDLYELHFCPCGLDPKTKISVDWLLYRDGELVNDNLYNYVDQFEIYTLYPELNQQGVCQSIHWLGGAVPAEWGFCTPQAPADMFSGVTSCNPTNYPGAMQVGQGTPGSVLSPLGLQVPAQGEFSIYSNNFDYFYMDFFTQTRTVVRIKWRQVGNYSLVMRIRQQNGGTAYDFGWGENPEIDKCGGHMSCCGQILAQDSIHYLVTGDFSKEVCENEPYGFGTINNTCDSTSNTYVFTSTVEDTMVLFGTYMQAHCCDHLVVDSVYTFHFYQRNTPEAIVKDTLVCQCNDVSAQSIINMVTYDPVDLDVADTSYLEWYRGSSRTVQVGEGTGTTTFLPLNIVYNHSFTQQIFTAEEVGTGLLNGISFYHSSSNDNKDIDVKVYLSSTSKTQFTSTSDWETASPKTLVYQGTVTVGPQGWVEFPFNVENFNYDGQGNLLVTVIGDDSWTYNHNWGQAPCTGYKSIYKYRDEAPYTIENGATEGYTSCNRVAYRNIVRFSILEEGWYDEPLVYVSDTAATYEYTVRQTNVYNNFLVLDGSQYDTIVCTGEPHTFTVTIVPMQVTISDYNAEYCVADFTGASQLVVEAEHVDSCATTTRWFAANANGDPILNDVIFEGDVLTIDSAFIAAHSNYNFAANLDGTVTFFAAPYKEGCLGNELVPFTITFHQTPVLEAVVTPESLLCPGSTSEMHVSITNYPLQVDPIYTYYWKGIDAADEINVYETTVNVFNPNTHVTTQGSLPLNNYYDYSYSQQIYTKDEVGEGTITSLGFHYAPNSGNSLTRNIEIWLSKTPKSFFNNSGSDWDTVTSNKVKVFDGQVTFVSDQWKDLEFTTPFDYTEVGDSNLLVTVIDKTGSYTTMRYFYTTPTGSASSPAWGARMAKRYYRDDYPLTNENIKTISGSELNNTGVFYRDDIRFVKTITEAEHVAYMEPEAEFEYDVTGDETSPYLPLFSYYEYNFTEQIYTADEVSGGVPGTITKLTFDYQGSEDIDTKDNVYIYLAHTDKTTFSDEDDIDWGNDYTLVYSGDFNCVADTAKEIILDNPFAFDGVSNLLLIVYDWSGDYNYYPSLHQFGVNNTGDSMAAIYRYDQYDDYIYDMGDPVWGSGDRDIVNYRNNINFTIVQNYPGFAPFNGNFKRSVAYKNLTPICDSDYVSNVYVVDANGCKSNVVTFNYTTGDTIAPVVTPATFVTYFPTCDTALFADAYTSVEAFNAAGFAEVTDNCDLNNISISYSDLLVSTNDTTCETRVERTYTFMDSCHNVATFTHILIGHDSIAPSFDIDRPMRLLPVFAGNCTFNAPDSMTLINMIAPYVADNCTDSTYLMSTVRFVWENTDESPIGATNIFEVKDHLTITAVITDRCGNNSDSTLVFFLDRPGRLEIGEPWAKDEFLCANVPDSLFFDPATIVDDPIAGPILPYTYTWSEANGRPVNFSDTNAPKTKVEFLDGGGDYAFVMTVSNGNGCPSVSDTVLVTVRPLPVMKINADVRNGATEPYCPTYGNLTVRAELIDPAELQNQHIPEHNYTWTGESVNELIDTISTWVTIIPEWCDTLYHVYLTVEDDLGCIGSTDTVFHVAANGPTFVGQLSDSTVAIADGCALIVPDFKDEITANMITDDCYLFSEIKADTNWYVQIPAAGDTFYTAVQQVMIIISNPCGKSDTTYVNALKPANYPTVSIDAELVAACYEEIMNGEYAFEATGTNLGTAPTWEWTVNTLTDSVIGVNNVLYVPGQYFVPENVSGDITYTLTVTATNTDNHCVIAESADFTVWYQGDDIDYTVWPNSMCNRNDGVIGVNYIPKDYVVTLRGIEGTVYGPVVKIQDVPYHESTPWNTVLFDSLASGLYEITVENLHGCERYDTAFVNEILVTPDTALYTVVPVTVCANNNGQIILTQEAGYTYTLYKNYNLTIVQPTYTGLATGTYYIKKENNATHCYSVTPVDVPIETELEQFLVDSVANTRCVASYDGKLILKTTGLHYWVYGPVDDPATSATTSQLPNNTQSSTISSQQNVNYLKHGTYYIQVYNPVTKCYGYDTVTVPNGIVMPTIISEFTANNNCATTNGTIAANAQFTGNGSYTFNKTDFSNSTSSYYLYKWNANNNDWGSSILNKNSTASNWNKLIEGTYRLVATDSKGCSVYDTFEIVNDLYFPVIDSTRIVENTSCNPEILAYNGSVEFFISADGENVIQAVPTCTYTVNLHDYNTWTDDWHSYNNAQEYGYVEVVQNGSVLAHLSIPYGSGHLSQTVDLAKDVEATFIYHNGNYYAQYRKFEILGPDGDTVWMKDYSTFTSANTSYQHQVTPNCEINGITPGEAFNTYIKNYTIKTGNTVNTYSTNDAIFSGLNSGIYNFTVTSKHGCIASKTDTVEQRFIPEMELVSTPNTMCLPTFERPGNGTVTVINPVADTLAGDPADRFVYNFYDEAGQQMDVPYNLPMTHTKYYLDDQRYHVVALEQATGCVREGYITVEFERTDVEILAHSIPNYSCTGSNGVIIIDNIYSSNEDARFGFSLNPNGPFTSAREFTGLANDIYTIYAYDSTLLCTYEQTITINTTDSCAPIITIWDNNLDTLDSYHYCWGAEGIQMLANAVDTCDNATFTYEWYAPCANPSSSNTSVIDVQTDHYVVNGCDYILKVTNNNTGCPYFDTVNVFIHPNPELVMTINGHIASTTLPNTYCEDQELHLAVQNHSQYGEALDVNTIQWTLGYVGTGVQAIDIMGVNYANDNNTFCVRAANIYGCMSDIISIPVSFNREQFKTVYDTACNTITIDGTTYTAILHDSAFVVTEVIDMSNTWTVGGLNLCDTTITHNVMLYANPRANFNVINEFTAAIYCGDTIVLDDIMDAVAETVTPASATVSIVKQIPVVGGNQQFDYIPFDENTTLNYDYRNTIFRVKVSSVRCGDIYSDPFQLDLRDNPTVDSFDLYAHAGDYYCPGQTVNQTVLVSNPSPVVATAKLYRQNGNSNVEIGSAVVPAHAVRQPVEFTFTVTHKQYNDTLLTVTVENYCGSASASKRAVVDTVFNVALSVVNPHCEGDTLKSSDFSFVGSYEANPTVYAQRATATAEQVIYLPYVLQLADTNMKVRFELTSHCGYHKFTSQATVVVIPNARLDVAPWDVMDLCYDDAVDSLNNYRTANITSTYADQEGWVLGKMVGQTVQFSEQLLNTSDLVDSVNNHSGYTFVGYRAVSALCGDTTAALGRLRILAPVTVSDATISLCPEAVNYNNVVTAAIAGLNFNRNHYFANEVDTTYEYKNANNVWVSAANISASVINSGAQVRVIFKPVINTNCGADTGYVTVNIKDTSRVAPVLQAACEGSAFKEFIAEYSQWTGDASILVDSFWTVQNAAGSFVKFTNMDTVFVENVNLQFVWMTQCDQAGYKSDVMTLDIKFNPSVNFDIDTLDVCLNATAPALTYTVTDNSGIVTDTVVTLNGVELDPDHIYTMDDNGAKIVVNVSSECADATDTVVVRILQLPVPQASGDTRICANGDATMQVVNPSSDYAYTWQFNGQDVYDGTQMTAHFAPADGGQTTVTIDGQDYTVNNVDNLYHFTVVATEIATGCVSATMINTSNDPFAGDVITVQATDAPQFIFKYQGNETHTIDNLTTGQLTDYTWEVSVPCTAADKLVFVEYTIYHNGEVINNDSLSNYLLTQTTSTGVSTNMWVTRNIIGWENSQQDSNFTRQYFRSSIPGFETPSGAQTGNHFPNNDMAFGNNQQFDDLYMHFLAGNPVKKTIAPFVQGGEYKIVYRLVATSLEDPYQHLYFNADSAAAGVNHGPTPAYLGLLKIGGHGAYGGTLTELAVDSIIMNVEGPNLVVNETPAAPVLAPAIDANEAVIAPEMEVWPNPAPSIITTFKARVYNMSGDATVTITNFAGKQVYNGNINIDSDNFYFEADVNSLAVGAYIMTVRTQDAVVSKKLVVTVRQ